MKIKQAGKEENVHEKVRKITCTKVSKRRCNRRILGAAFSWRLSAPQQCWVSLCFSRTMPFGNKALKPKLRPSSFGDVIKGFCQLTDTPQTIVVLRKTANALWVLNVKHSVKHAVPV